jgi:hypothetical protein
MHTVVDYPSNSLYFGEFNSGWESGDERNDILSLAINGAGYAIKFDHRLAYQWVSGGWNAPHQTNGGFGDIARYYGFLKSLYTLGALGAVAGYFDYPDGGFNATFASDQPPHWLEQVEALGHIHAEFSHLEEFLRNGDLLPGPATNFRNPDQPAYEFPTGHANTRVLVRKLKLEDRWLISAWAADGIVRTVNVRIPGLGVVAVQAHPAGSLYHAQLTTEGSTVTPLDLGSKTPSPLDLALPTPITAPAGLKVVQ